MAGNAPRGIRKRLNAAGAPRYQSATSSATRPQRPAGSKRLPPFQPFEKPRRSKPNATTKPHSAHVASTHDLAASPCPESGNNTAP
jgi:hypothetical protein